MDQFSQMKTMLTSFLEPRKETTRIAFCNYLASEFENVEETYSQNFKNSTVKILCEIQSRVEERNHQPQQPTFSKSTSITSTYVLQTYQQQSAASAREYISTIPEIQMPASQTIQPAHQTLVMPRGQQQYRTCQRATTWDFKTPTFHHQLNQCPQPTVSSLCHRRRNCIQHLRTLAYLGTYSQS